MNSKHLLKAKLKRLRLLRFSPFTPGGVGLEGSYLSMTAEKRAKKPVGRIQI